MNTLIGPLIIFVNSCPKGTRLQFSDIVLECLNLARYPGYFWNSYCYQDFLLSNRLSARNPGYYWEAYGYRDFLVSMRYSGEGCPILKNLAPQ